MFAAKLIRPWLTAIALTIALQGCAPINQDSAQRALAEGRLNDAAYDIQAALAHDPDNLTLKNLAAQIFTQRGVKSYQSGAMIAASEDFHRAIDYFPTYAPAYDYLGMLSFQQRNWRDAIKYGSMGAGYAGQPYPSYVRDARENLRRVQSGGTQGGTGVSGQSGS
jgi:tetratricopeptide (TPR) repeat protein